MFGIYERTVLQSVINNLINNSNLNSEFAYEMFAYLLSIGADINKKYENGNDIFFDINQITDQDIKNNLYKIIENYIKTMEFKRNRK